MRCGEFTLDLGRPQVMGILNVTPDSFSDGGRFASLDAALEHGLRMQDEGAALIDVGGESTRPGAVAVPLDLELERVIPVIEALAPELRIPISVDTSKPEVMRAAVAAGAGMINDVHALQAEGAAECVASLGAGVAVVLMHRQGRAADMQNRPHYLDVVDEVIGFLHARAQRLRGLGLADTQMLFDPGIGFGKTLAHNLSLLKALPRFVDEFQRIALGVSRKSMFSQLLGERAPVDRVAASVQTALLAADAGAILLRVHDVAATVEALRLLRAIQTAE